MMTARQSSFDDIATAEVNEHGYCRRHKRSKARCTTRAMHLPAPALSTNLQRMFAILSAPPRQLVNPAVSGFQPCSAPAATAIAGRHCSLLPVTAVSIQLHGEALYSKYREEGDQTWTYLPYGPFDSCDHYLAWLLSLAERREGLTNDAIPCATCYTFTALFQHVALSHCFSPSRIPRPPHAARSSAPANALPSGSLSSSALPPSASAPSCA